MLRSAIGIFIVLFLTSSAYARMITDMVGRKISVPDRIEKAVGQPPPASYLIYAIDPSLLAGLNFPLWESEKKYTAESYRTLPVIGGMVGDGRTLNQEVLLKIKPDVAFLWSRGTSYDAINMEYERMLRVLGIPAVYVRLDSMQDYPGALLFMGDVLNRRERAAQLNRYAVGVLQRVNRALAALPPVKKVSVYYAEGVDGLSTEGEQSSHAELIPLSGGKNVCQLRETSINGMERISMEQLVMYDPDIILVKEKVCFERIKTDARWKRLRAVRSNNVHLIPHVPFNWFDRPPSYMRLLGIQWLANLLHPERYPIDMIKETKAFYRLFLGVDITDREARDIVRP